MDLLNADLKLLVDARDQLVQEQTRVRNRLHALLLVMAPGYREATDPLTTHRALAAARQLAVGFNCAGEIGPVGGKNFLHGFTASIALFVDA